jgi:hypothetical protein
MLMVPKLLDYAVTLLPLAIQESVRSEIPALTIATSRLTREVFCVFKNYLSGHSDTLEHVGPQGRSGEMGGLGEASSTRRNIAQKCDDEWMTEPLTMRKLREIFRRTHECDRSQREIANSLSVS